ncbi:MAG: AsnC family transcriptional regulator [Sphingomonas sp.]|nr:AsnC family transcriptional regulator [Sphingomonas sp.]
MDAVDLQIIQIMREDARLPLKTIAGKVGLARSSVRSPYRPIGSHGCDPWI